MSKRRNALKKSVTFVLALSMGMSQIPYSVFASEELQTETVTEVASEAETIALAASEGETVVTEVITEAPVETAAETQEVVEEVPTEMVVETDAPEPETNPPVPATEETVTEEETATEAPTEAPTEAITEAPTEEVTEAPTEVVTEEFTEPTTEDITDGETEETQTEAETEEKVPFDVNGTYNNLKASWSGDRDQKRDTLILNTLNNVGNVKYKSGAGHSGSYLASRGISGVTSDLYTANNPEYLDDTGLIAWSYWFAGAKDAANWVADNGVSGIDTTDLFQQVDREQLLPGDVGVSSDGYSAIYAGNFNGSEAWVDSHWTNEEPELGVSFNTSAWKGYSKFYRYTGFSDAIVKESEEDSEEVTGEVTEEVTEEESEGVAETEVGEEVIETEETTEDIPEEGTEESTEVEQEEIQSADDEITYSFEDDSVVITAYVQSGAEFHVGDEVVKVESNDKTVDEEGNAISVEDMVLIASPVKEGTEEYELAYAAVKESVELGENEKLEFIPYDVYFEYNGQKLEPLETKVRIEMNFKNDTITKGNAEDESEKDVFIAHIKNDGNVEKLDNMSEDENKISFEVSSF